MSMHKFLPILSGYAFNFALTILIPSRDGSHSVFKFRKLTAH